MEGLDLVFSITIDWENDDNDVCTGFPYIHCVFHPCMSILAVAIMITVICLFPMEVHGCKQGVAIEAPQSSFLACFPDVYISRDEVFRW
jgi:hypothetical protein